MKIIELIGFIAGTLTTISFLPQVIKTWKLKSAKGISLSMFLLFSTGVLLWLAYGVYINNWILIFFNSITLLLSSTIIYFKVSYK